MLNTCGFKVSEDHKTACYIDDNGRCIDLKALRCTKGCEGCYFEHLCENALHWAYCYSYLRKDNTSIIWVEDHDKKKPTLMKENLVKKDNPEVKENEVNISSGANVIKILVNDKEVARIEIPGVKVVVIKG